MSYSRWSNSVWYTFWSGYDSCANDARFEICDFSAGLSFTYREIKEDVDACIVHVRDYYSKEHDREVIDEIIEVEDLLPKITYKTVSVKPVHYTDDQYEELKGYMLEHVKQVEKEYGKS